MKYSWIVHFHISWKILKSLWTLNETFSWNDHEISIHELGMVHELGMSHTTRDFSSTFHAQMFFNKSWTVEGLIDFMYSSWKWMFMNNSWTFCYISLLSHLDFMFCIWTVHDYNFHENFKDKLIQFMKIDVHEQFMNFFAIYLYCLI